jgi:hypothetical protein
VRRHAKASSSASTAGKGSTPGSTTRGSLAGRVSSFRVDESGTPAGRHSSMLGLVGLAALALLALIPASASALVTRAPLPFSPITGSGTETHIFSAAGVAVDEANGNIAVGDTSGNSVDFFSATGGVPTGVASPYQITGFRFFGEPVGMAFDNSSPASASKGALYLTDSENFSEMANSFKKYVRNAGTEKYELAGSLHPSSGPAFNQPLGGVAVDRSTGNVFVSDWGSGTVLEFGPTGTEISRINVQPAVNRPSTLAVDLAGDLFVGRYRSGRVVKYSAANLTPGDISPPFTEVISEGAAGLAVDQTTNTLFVGVGNHVQEYDATTLAKGQQFGAGANSEVASIAVNSATEQI